MHHSKNIYFVLGIINTIIINVTDVVLALKELTL